MREAQRCQAAEAQASSLQQQLAHANSQVAAQACTFSACMWPKMMHALLGNRLSVTKASYSTL